MKFDDLDKMSPLERREFLTSLSGFLAFPMLPKATYEAVYEIVFGREAMAQSAQPINLIEINFRDQWDWGHLFVPPSVRVPMTPFQAEWRCSIAPFRSVGIFMSLHKRRSSDPI
jgi:hypothetical protein